MIPPELHCMWCGEFVVMEFGDVWFHYDPDTGTILREMCMKLHSVRRAEPEYRQVVIV